MIETELNKVLNYMKQYVENICEHDSEPMLNYKDLQLVLDEIERLNNIINGVEKELFIKKEFYERELTKRPKNDSEHNTQYADSCALAQISVIYDKLQELKGSDK